MEIININSLDYYQNEPEGQFLDRKSARMRPKDILKHFVAFANAEGGQLVIGIEDDGTISGFKDVNAHRPEEFINLSITELRNTPLLIDYTLLNVENVNGESDQILVFDIPLSPNRVIKSFDERTYLRQADNSMNLNVQQVIQLEYDRGQRFFEDETLLTTGIKDIDLELLQDYREKMDAPNLSFNDILEARNLMIDGKITHAGILLFGKNPTRYLPQARIKVVKYEGNSPGTGKNLNIIKEKTFETAIPKLITEVTDFIRTQLREFQYLEEQTVKFKKTPEYPEFAWFEGVVNAATHRDYSIRGDYIKILIFDDRMEIDSPGLLPNIVTINNIKNTRYSRNPRIARILSEFGWVKEMNEGVKRIYSEMESLFLNEPIYSEPNRNVLLILENNIMLRSMRVNNKLSRAFSDGLYETLSDDEKNVITNMYNTGRATNTSKTAGLLSRSPNYSRKLLRRLAEQGILTWHGNSNTDSRQHYTLNINE